MEWSYISRLVVVLLLLVFTVQGSDRNVQRFVKIDVSKINVKNASDPNSANTSTTTVVNEPVTEGSTTISTAEQSTPTVTSTTPIPASTVSIPSDHGTTASLPTSTPGAVPTDPSPLPFTPGRTAKLVPEGYYCRCDLTINACDVNCCCDIDCDKVMLRSFDCNEETLHKDEYHHDEGLQSCRVQGGLFCLVEPIYEEGDDSHYDTKRLPHATRHKWKDLFPVDVSPSSSSSSAEDIRYDQYRVDDVVYFYNESSELVQPFVLPYSLTGGTCQVEQPVRFLRNRIDLCRRTVDELGNFNRAFLRHHAAQTRFFRTPKKSTVMERYCADDVDCLNATLSVCHSNGNGWNCTQDATNSSSTNTMEESIENDSGVSCQGIEITFIHNYTHLLEVRMKITCQSYPADQELWEEIVWQRITVRFADTTPPGKSNVIRSVSGSIGYLTGKPLIVTHMELPSNNTATNQDTPAENMPNPMLAYFTNGTRLPDGVFRLRIPMSRRNRCVPVSMEHGMIDFGVDSHHRCNYVPMEFTNQTGSPQNFTRFCSDLQQGLYGQLLPGVHRMPATSAGEGYDRLNLYLSKYANPRNRTADWVQVRSTNVIANAQPGAEPSDPTDGYFTCSNMLINVDYRFYYARERVRGVRHQAILRDAEIVFGPRVNLRFRLDEDIRVPIFVQVQFFDLTSSSVGVLSWPEFTVLPVVSGLLIIMGS